MIIKENTRATLATWIENYTEKIQPKFSCTYFSQSDKTVSKTKSSSNLRCNCGRCRYTFILRDNFDAIFSKYPETLIFGEDSGNIGDVNQGLEGMQENTENYVLPM